MWRRKTSTHAATTSPDAITAKKLLQLSMEERSKGLNELHGIDECVEETPELVAESLARMQHYETATVVVDPSAASALAYQRVIREAPDYVASLRLAFLRSERFQPAAAAARLHRHLETKQQLFGPGTLGRDIEWNDLTEQDVEHLQSGYLQFLPRRDRAGRAIGIMFGNVCFRLPIESTLRLVFLSFMAIAVDEEIQRKGIVLIYYGIDQEGFVQDRPAKLFSMWLSLPLRTVGLHMCYNRPLLVPLISTVSLVLSASQLCRFRSHFGTNMECLYALITFGIPKEILPMDVCLEGGGIDTRFLEEWIQTLQRQRQRRNNNSTIVIPGPLDILGGRGRHTQLAPGNLRYKNLLESYRAQYESSDRFDKMVLSGLIATQLRQDGSRFVRQSPSDDDDGCWVELDEEQVRSKISHAFRNMRMTTATTTEVANQRPPRDKRTFSQIVEPRSASSVLSTEQSFSTLLRCLWDYHDVTT